MTTPQGTSTVVAGDAADETMALDEGSAGAMGSFTAQVEAAVAALRKAVQASAATLPTGPAPTQTMCLPDGQGYVVVGPPPHLPPDKVGVLYCSVRKPDGKVRHRAWLAADGTLTLGYSPRSDLSQVEQLLRPLIEQELDPALFEAVERYRAARDAARNAEQCLEIVDSARSAALLHHGHRMTLAALGLDGPAREVALSLAPAFSGDADELVQAATAAAG